MDRPKLNYRFHNPNRTNDGLIKELMHIFIAANREKAEEAIRQCALAQENVYRVVSIPRAAKIAARGEETIFKMPKGKQEKKTYFLPNKYIREGCGEYVLEVPEDFMIELYGKEKEMLTMDEFIKEVAGKTKEDYESSCGKRSDEIAAKQEKARKKNSATARSK